MNLPFPWLRKSTSLQVAWFCWWISKAGAYVRECVCVCIFVSVSGEWYPEWRPEERSEWQHIDKGEWERDVWEWITSLRFKSIFKTIYVMPFAKVKVIAVWYFPGEERSEKEKREGGGQEREFPYPKFVQGAMPSVYRLPLIFGDTYHQIVKQPPHVFKSPI